MAQVNPITFAETVNLASLGIAAENLRFGECTLESDSHVVIREKQTDGSSVINIVDLRNPQNMVRRPIQAEAAVMCPNGNVLALRAGNMVQMFNIAEKRKVKSFKFDSEDVSVGFYWRWATPEVLAMVTSTSVYHWSLSGEKSADPVKVFERHADLASSQIISYRLSQNEKWCSLVGISQGSVPGTIEGKIQLYSMDKRVSQSIDGHAACFSVISVEGTPRQVFSFVERKSGVVPKLYCMEVGKDKDAPGGVFKVFPQEIAFPAEAQADFPVCLLPSSRHDLLYCITKLGYLYVLDTFTAETLYRNRVSQETVFVTCSTEGHAGLLGITAKTGRVLKLGLNDSVLVPYLLGIGKAHVALRLATKLGLPGVDNLVQTEFERALASGNLQAAARVAADSPRGILRTLDTIARFQALPPVAGQPSPVLQYFQVLLSSGRLNAVESVELCRPVIAGGRLPMIATWLAEDKLTGSEQLGDMLQPVDPALALQVFQRGHAPDRVLATYVAMGDFNAVLAFAKQSGTHPDYVVLLQNLVRQDSKKAETFAKLLVADYPPLVSPTAVVDIFMQLGKIQETTAFLLEALKGNREADGALQTRLLEINLLGGAPQVADAILASEMFTRYDRRRVGTLCEKCGLYQRALEHYSDPADVKRVIVYTQALNPDWLLAYFGTLPPADALACLHLLLTHNLASNLGAAVKVAGKYIDRLGAGPLIEVFAAFKSYEGLYYFLGSALASSQDPLVHNKYLEAAVKMGHVEQVIKHCRESAYLDPGVARDLLIAEKFADPRALIFVCDRFGFVDALTTYLFSAGLHKHLLVYVEKMSPHNAPAVVGKLLDLDADEALVSQVLGYAHQCPVERLVEEVERRNRLRLLRPYLENLVNMGHVDPATHNALAKIKIATGDDPETFLTHNSFYDAKVVGAFARKLDPHLSFLCYKRAWGSCDDDLLTLAYDNGLFKDLARYLVERKDAQLWARVLAPPASPARGRVVEETVQTALPECREPEAVSAAVRAFMAANLPRELLQVLDRLVLEGTPGDGFSDNANLQDLLVWTAIQSEPSRVLDLVHRLDGFNAVEMAQRCCLPQYGLFEEALEMLRKVGRHVEALEVLLVHMANLDRAVDLATRLDEARVWSRLGRAQLDQLFVREAVESFLRAEDAEYFPQVIAAATQEEKYDDLVRFLRMARRKVKDPVVDTELVFALARTHKLADLEEVVSSPNVAQVQEVGDRCFDAGMYEAATVLFASISNNAQLARCHVKLGRFKEAVECARKANVAKSWTEVHGACVGAGEWKLAELAGLHLLKSPDHVDDLVVCYEQAGQFDKLVTLFEKGLALEGAHKAVFTTLAVLYAKYAPERLMGHIRAHAGKLLMAKVIHACETQRLWAEAVLAYHEVGEFDHAVRVVMDHGPVTGDTDLVRFATHLTQVRNPELVYKAVPFYLTTAPERLGALMVTVRAKLDHTRMVSVLRKHHALFLALDYLQAVAEANVAAVNEALHDLYIEEENPTALYTVVRAHTNFDHPALARKLEKHELAAFRRVAASLYAQQGKFADAVALLKRDKLYLEAMETAAMSADRALVLDLLTFFVREGERECVTAALYSCYAVLSPDAVLELVWRHGLSDVAMPFFIQWTRDTAARLAVLEERTRPPETDSKTAAAPEATSYLANNPAYMIANTAYNELPPGGGPVQQQQQYQYQYQPPPQPQQQPPPPQGYPLPPGYGYQM